jgi:hypothetical protein
MGVELFTPGERVTRMVQSLRNNKHMMKKTKKII